MSETVFRPAKRFLQCTGKRKGKRADSLPSRGIHFLKTRREEKRKRRHNACRTIYRHAFFRGLIPSPSFLPDDRRAAETSSGPASQTGRYPYRYAAGRFRRMPCKKRPARKRFSSPNARRYRAGRRSPSPAQAKIPTRHPSRETVRTSREDKDIRERA